MRLALEILDGELAVVRLDPAAPLPAWLDWSASPFVSATRTADELSIVCAGGLVPAAARAERGWRAVKVRGPLGFALTGILRSLLAPLAEAGLSVFALSTFDTDYVLVRASDLARARALLGTDHDVVA